MASDKVAVRRVRRRYSQALKADVMAACDAPGASVAKVAMARGINANVVHRWRQKGREGGQSAVVRPREFVAVTVAPQTSMPAPAGRDIAIELRRGSVTMKLSWPVSAAAELAAWTAEVLL